MRSAAISLVNSPLTNPQGVPIWGTPRGVRFFSPSCLKPRESLKNPLGDSLGTPYFWGLTGENKGDSLGIHQGVRIFEGTHR